MARPSAAHPGPVAASARVLAVGAILSGLLVPAAPSPASAKDERAALPPVETLGSGNECTWARTIKNWKAVDREHIIIDGAANTRYLVRLDGTCFANPRFEIAIGVYSRDSRLCPYGGDSLIIDGEHCTIVNIWKLPGKGDQDRKKDEPLDPGVVTTLQDQGR